MPSCTTQKSNLDENAGLQFVTNTIHAIFHGNISLTYKRSYFKLAFNEGSSYQKFMITLEGVTKVFQSKERSFTALNNIHLSINKGEYIAIIGKSGSGKSTLLNMITGIDHPTSGKIRLNDTEIGHFNESQLATWRGKNIGIVFQFFQLIPTLTILENLLLAMEFVNVIPKPERIQRAKSLLSDVGISEQANKMPASLSGGEQQRAAIARALANNPHYCCRRTYRQFGQQNSRSNQHRL